MSWFPAGYVLGWSSFCLVAAAILIRDRESLRPEWRRYARLLAVPWKLAVFVPGLLFVTFAGRFTDDETWDVVTGSGMSILTFLTSAWAIGLVYGVLTGRRPARYLVVASALWLLSSSWFYDGYLLWRDGAYTPRWLGNLMLSPIIYLAAGLLWNLEARPEGGFGLSFTRQDWPEPPANRSFAPLLVVSIPLVLVAVFFLVAFVRWRVAG